jgi:hypothetical protein
MTDITTDYGTMKVWIVGSDMPSGHDERPKEYRVSHRTWYLNASNPYLNIAPYDPGRIEMHVEPIDYPVILASSISQASDLDNSASSVISTPAFTVTTPGMPASTVAVQNPYSVPVQVVISSGTVTAVVVNGITVGAGDGTYYVPAYGAISITYSVAPNWAWTGIGIPVTVTSLATPNGRLLTPTVGEYVIPGPDETWIAAAQYPARIGVTIVRCI